MSDTEAHYEFPLKFELGERVYCYLVGDGPGIEFRYSNPHAEPIERPKVSALNLIYWAVRLINSKPAQQFAPKQWLPCFNLRGRGRGIGDRSGEILAEVNKRRHLFETSSQGGDSTLSNGNSLEIDGIRLERKEGWWVFSKSEMSIFTALKFAAKVVSDRLCLDHSLERSYFPWYCWISDDAEASYRSREGSAPPVVTRQVAREVVPPAPMAVRDREVSPLSILMGCLEALLRLLGTDVRLEAVAKGSLAALKPIAEAALASMKEANVVPLDLAGLHASLQGLKSELEARRLESARAEAKSKVADGTRDKATADLDFVLRELEDLVPK